MSNKLLYITFSIVLVSVAVSVSNYLEIKETMRVSDQYKTSFGKILNSTVRLSNPNTGYQFCSGTVVTKVQVLTAAHCLANIPANETVSISSQDGLIVSAGTVQSVSEDRADYGTISGDFSMFPSIQVEDSALKIEKAMNNDKLMGCGYPYSGNLSCTILTNCKHFEWRFACDGFMYPGMSGGTVIDIENNTIIAIMRGISKIDDYSLVKINPTVSLWKELGVVENQ